MAYAMQKNSGSRRRIKLLFSLIAIGFVYSVYLFVQQMTRIDEKQLEMLTLQKQLDAYRATHSSYQLEIRRLNDPEYMIQRDRTMLHMTKENEIPFILQGSGE